MSEAVGVRAELPRMPDGYGVPNCTSGLLAWDLVEAELVASHSYWLTSVRPDGRPHVVPRWGVWLDDHFYYDGSPATRHTRSVEANPAVTLNLESVRRRRIRARTVRVVRRGRRWVARHLADPSPGLVRLSQGLHAIPLS